VSSKITLFGDFWWNPSLVFSHGHRVLKASATTRPPLPMSACAPSAWRRWWARPAPSSRPSGGPSAGSAATNGVAKLRKAWRSCDFLEKCVIYIYIYYTNVNEYRLTLSIVILAYINITIYIYMLTTNVDDVGDGDIYIYILLKFIIWIYSHVCSCISKI